MKYGLDVPKTENLVAPFAGAWIEICADFPITFSVFVAPFAGAWIEIILTGATANPPESRSLRGSVD